MSERRGVGYLCVKRVVRPRMVRGGDGGGYKYRILMFNIIARAKVLGGETFFFA